MYKTETRGGVIKVEPDFLEDESEPAEARFIWAYTIEIENTGDDTVQLLSREWEITDARGRTEIVRGEGVVGEQPVLKPGERFRYTSGAPLTTASGFMRGCYTMESSAGDRFSAAIPAFALDTPYSALTVH
jgi:ApaG protein